MLYHPKKARLLKAMYVAFLATGAFFTVGFSTSRISFYQLGQICGTLSLSGLTLQLLMGARVKLLEQGIGLDKIMRWHSFNARLTFLFILLHPTFLFAPSLLSGTTSLSDILSFFTLYHFLGIAAFLLIIFTIVTTLYQSRIKLNYEHWKMIHKVGYVIVTLGFIHSFFVGTDIIARKSLYYWWFILATLSSFAIIYRYIIRPWFLRKSIYQIVKIVKESPDVRSIYLKPLDGKIFSYFPGQFAFVRFYSRYLSSEEHHFTLSSSPLHNPISFTVKESGDFTSQLDRLKRGDRARIEGPFGAFSNVGMKGPFVFIAGGIGITPLMSMIRYMCDTKREDNTLLIYSAKTKRDLVFYNELEEIRKGTKWFKAIFVLSQESGRITPQLLRKYLRDFFSPTFFVVGPEPMMDAMKDMLLTLGAKQKNIFKERFALK